MYETIVLTFTANHTPSVRVYLNSDPVALYLELDSMVLSHQIDGYSLMAARPHAMAGE